MARTVTCWVGSAVTDLPVIRPVACMDKQEIIEVAHKIGTFDISVRPFEDCCTVFVPKFPSTKPRKDKCERYEQYFDWEPLVRECVEGVEVVTVRAGKPLSVDGDTTDEICSLL